MKLYHLTLTLEEAASISCALNNYVRSLELSNVENGPNDNLKKLLQEAEQAREQFLLQTLGGQTRVIQQEGTDETPPPRPD